jgi:hypothetical protein
MLNVPCWVFAKRAEPVDPVPRIVPSELYFAPRPDLNHPLNPIDCKPKMARRITFDIAGICIAIESKAGLDDWDINAAYRPFVGNRKADIRLHVLGGSPSIFGATQVFDSSPVWTLHQLGETSIFKIYDQLNNEQRFLVVDPDIQTAKLYFPNPDGNFINPFYGPTLELLLIQYLAQERGLIVHACGIDDGGGGMLFVGESGAGKSTLSNLWHQHNGITILSDDRIILRKKNGAFWMHGTPWHGEARFVSPRSAKLDHIFFLKHARTNAVRALNRADTVVEFLKASFPPFWDNRGVEFAMAFLSDLTKAVQCRELSFKPDGSVIDFIKAQGTGHKTQGVRRK